LQKDVSGMTAVVETPAVVTVEVQTEVTGSKALTQPSAAELGAIATAAGGTQASISSLVSSGSGVTAMTPATTNIEVGGAKTTNTISRSHVFAGEMTLMADGVTEEDLRQSVKATLSAELELGTDTLIEIVITSARRLKNLSEASLRRLATTWTISFSVRMTEPAAKAASAPMSALQKGTSDVSGGSEDFGKTLKNKLYSKLESSGRSSAAFTMWESFAVKTFSAALSMATTTTQPPSNSKSTTNWADIPPTGQSGSKRSTILHVVLVFVAMLSQ
jgi:hypothetical protein